MAKLEPGLMAEATAFGAVQGAAGAAASFDSSGAASLPLRVGGNVAHKAWLTSVQARTRAASAADLQAQYKKYGMNPDGTPSGKPGPGSAP
jgi:hypothetical protein